MDEDDFDGADEGPPTVFAPDPVVARGGLLIEIADMIDEVENEEARHFLLDYMALVLKSVAVAFPMEKRHDLN